MKKKKRCLSALLVLCLVASATANTAFAAEREEEAFVSPKETDTPLISTDALPDVIENSEAVKNGYVARDESAENDLNTLIFDNTDGTKTMRVFDYPVKYIDDNNEVKDISLKIANNIQGDFVSADHSVTTTFSQNINDGISLKYDGIDITMLPSQDISSAASLSSDQKTVTYAYDDKTTLEYSLTYTGFKENIIVSEYTGQTEYEFLVRTNGLNIIEKNGSFYFADTDGEIQANIGDIVIFTADERNNTFGQLSCEEVIENQEYRLTIHVDGDYLKDEKTAYPITIDPTVEVTVDNGSGAIEDVTINSSSGSDGSSYSLTVGKRSTYGISRILMKFPGLDMSSLPGKELISSAKVELRDLMCEEEALMVACNVFTGNTWTESTATWSNVSPTNIGMPLGSKTISYAKGAALETPFRYSFDITTAVKGWKDGTYSQNKGIIFRAPTSIEDGSTYISKTFASYNRSSYRPSLTVVYKSPSIVGTVSSVPYGTGSNFSANAAHEFIFRPNVTTKYSIWTSGTLNSAIYVYDNSTLTHLVYSSTSGGHGSNACMTKTLTAGKQYYIVLTGGSSTATGHYNFHLMPGLPQSGSEQPSYFSDYNGEYQYFANCYIYALGLLKNPLTNTKFGIGGADPGYLYYNQNCMVNLATAETAKSTIVSLVKKDCVALGGSENDFYEVTEDTMVPSGYYKVALVYGSNVNGSGDYHWYRQVSDAGNKWAHKPGTTQATYIDADDMDIYFPESANTGNYTYFLGYFAMKVHTVT